ncbi:MAG: hypothetical protein LBE67_16315 [Kocuria palustris]|nr:hypothetical protein [Kocuria palustris]
MRIATRPVHRPEPAGSGGSGTPRAGLPTRCPRRPGVCTSRSLPTGRCDAPRPTSRSTRSASAPLTAHQEELDALGGPARQDVRTE